MRDRFPVGTFQFLLFIAVAALVLPLGVNYIAGAEGFGSKLRLHASLQDAFGLSEGTGVTLRGVDVGTVTDSRLAPGGTAAEVELTLRGGTEISKDSYLQVTMGSMAGIQSVDIVTASASGPFLQDGDRIAAPADKQPMQMDTIILKAANMLETVRDGSVATIGTELATAFAGDTDSMAKLVANGSALASMVRRNAPLISGLLGDWVNVLDAMADTTASFESGMRSVASFTDQLDAAQPVFIYLLDHSPEALARATALFDKYRGTFGGVLANLATVEPIIADRDDALRMGLKTIPQGLQDLRSIVKNNRADFTLLGTQGPVCLFYDEPRRTIGDLSPSQPNLARYCPPGDGHGQRGAVNAPRPNDLGTRNWKRPGGVAGPPAVTDPLLVPDGAELLLMWKDLLERTRNGK
ncbi:MlaD family protein [Gordonia sp. (in: high G+C Gram-positive bacteria)]|uniref:MlaD family protein n=1 Tax=Gordonia sp. (in: high G+C Gram-positive bacteria) TaxID=84139 RepID=UPI0016A8BBE0|nr:MlaD family protein [Gordonia sp. (in: high G+C Gram-positive bacteria)]NLG48066.1 MCE family protein [Gordonia sp. (in: high G+C Gram-positive bacteria)]